ncbi:hypothetical protein HHK36_013752 [Tetracentron sinense]|uniref:KIB1-4 beta-propeller domain-containing protein n=1 Tax=Tetracentron sinense TaxID=13715 RepID=A0A834Z3U5_TETSI|nr:hypothetical protein HHK36_013752 [Tetracentron sinense]
MESICSEMIWVSPNFSTSCSATESGIKGNCIYIVVEEDKKLLEDISREHKIRISENEKMEGRQTKQKITKEDKKVEAEDNLWSVLPRELHNMIAKHLTLPLDYMNFRAVCRACRSAVPRIQWKTNLTGSTVQSPWLIFFQQEKGICNFFDPMYNTCYCMEIPEILGARICFSKENWLLMSKGKHCMFFLNPFTKENIQLPDLRDNYCFASFCFTSSPVSSDWSAIGLKSHCSHDVRIALLRCGEAAWTNIICDNDLPFFVSYNNPVFYEGAFHCLGEDGNLGVFDLREDGWTWTILPTPQRPCSSIRDNFMVECDDELVSVFVGHMGEWIQVFKLDHANMAWVDVKSLEDQTLFLSRSTSISAKVMGSRMQNRIYFPIFFSNNNCNGLYYFLETDRWNSITGEHSSEDLYDSKEQLHCTWTQPNLVWTRL